MAGIVTFKIAHLSDLHLAKHANVEGFLDIDLARQFSRVFELFRRFSLKPSLTSYSSFDLRALCNTFSELNSKTRDYYDIYLFTGDLSTTGEPEDLAVAREFLTGSNRIGNVGIKEVDSEPGFAFPLHRLALMPGNHDRYLGRSLRAKSQKFEDKNHFDTGWRLDGGVKNPEISHPRINKFTFSKDGETLHIIAVDVSFTPQNCPYSLLKYLGRGQVEKDVIESLEKISADSMKTGAVVWAVHYPINVDHKTLGLNNREDLISLALKLKIPYIFSGHTHVADKAGHVKCELSSHVTRIICAGTACANDIEEKMYYEIDLKISSKKILADQVHIKKMINVGDSDSSEYGEPRRYIEIP